MEFEPLLNDEAAARLLGGLHVKTLQRMARKGEIPAHKIGRYWFFRLSEIEAWLHSSCASARTGAQSANRPCLLGDSRA
jgi:excisionase family DNA binding protein